MATEQLTRDSDNLDLIPVPPLKRGAGAVFSQLLEPHSRLRQPLTNGRRGATAVLGSPQVEQVA
jgi:hypothetical protein